jgi:hypothetical protein
VDDVGEPEAKIEIMTVENGEEAVENDGITMDIEKSSSNLSDISISKYLAF